MLKPLILILTLTLTLILLPTLCHANGDNLRFPPGFIVDAADERRAQEQEKLNSHMIKSMGYKTVNSETRRNQGAHYIDGNQPVIVISDTRTYGKRVDLGYVVMPKKERYGR